MINTLSFSSPLVFGLFYSMAFNPGIPNSIIIPTIGGGLMNLGFWLSYKNTIGSIPELSKLKKNNFLLSSILHLLAILILITVDIAWIFEI